ncbi:protein PAXX-like isoform X2 [Xenopus laevis]|uniref:Protein PAXX-like isoform X2 n=1 Tax=Xenopus laevis TaxID=8355 RepID=A0A8J1LHS2_XENLA|nr:protein PAXX-like isoform X2 [Xenopus laevis]
MDKTPPQSLKSDPPTSTLSPPSPGSCFINTMDGRLQRWFPLATLKYDGQRYLCHGRGGDSSSSPQIVHVTNGAEVWGADVTEETLDEWSNSPQSARNGAEKLKETFQCSSPVLDVQGSSAKLLFPKHSGNVTLCLFKLPVSEARAHVQSLIFDLTDRVWELEKLQKEGAPTSASPVKVSQTPQSLLFQDLDSRKKGYGTSAPQLKKRIPGESLINPGSKSKKAARGVDFDDA